MNTLTEACRPVEDERVVVFLNQAKDTGLAAGEPALFLEPSMRLFEEPTCFLRARYVESGRRRSPRTWANVAYALAGWFDYLTAAGVADWRTASRDDLIAYRDAYLGAISPKTGAAYATGTVAGRMSAVQAFYDFAAERGWCAESAVSSAMAIQAAPILLDRNGLAHTRRGHRGRVVNDLLPTCRPSRTGIRPFLVSELRAFLNELGPRTSEGHASNQRPSRDRLIASIGVYVGLRNDEIHQLTRHQFLAMHPDPEAEWADQRLTVVGKGSVTRTVAIPNWLVQDILSYIQGERRAAVRAGGLTGRKELPDLFVSGLDSNAPGRPVTHRRFQQIVTEACIRAGVVDIVARTDPSTGEVVGITKAKHCVHDLRHTYAVLTYWAEKEGGNAEPWKKIQAQLGHRHLGTTTDTYLPYVEIFEQHGRLVDVRKIIGL